MKKKGIILLTSAILGVGLIGGTLAGWAVTDKADPLSIGVSPGTITTDDTAYITLSWGSSQTITNVSKLKKDETRVAGVLDLRADTESTADVTGNFRMKAASTNETLKTNLVVDVYEGNIPAYDKTDTAYEAGDKVVANQKVYQAKAAIAKPAGNFDEEKWTALDAEAAKKVVFGGALDADGYSHVNLDVTKKNQANPYTVVIYLNTSLTQEQYDALVAANAKASLTFDWGIGTEEEVVTTTKVYYTGDYANPYVYAFKGEDLRNKEWPGVAMTPAYVNGYFVYELDLAKYEYVVFNNGVIGEGEAKSEDIKISDILSGGNNCVVHSGVSWTYSTHNDEVESDYYLVGENLKIGSTALPAWTSDPLGRVTLTAGKATITVNTDGNARLKFYDKGRNIWYANSADDFTLDMAGSYELTFTPDGETVIGAKQL